MLSPPDPHPMAATRTAAGHGFTLSVRYPSAGWDFAQSVVPALRSPHELCALSNRPLRKLSARSAENTPDVSGLGASGVLIWIYYEMRNDPLIKDPGAPPIPDYSRYSYPLAYGEAQIFPARDYSWGTDLNWRRVGHNLAPVPARPEAVAVTVMIWEGVRVPAVDLRAAEAIVASVNFTQGDVTN
jgi:hypothetical protein